MPLFLTSLTFAGLADWLRRHGHPGPVAMIVNASRELADGEALVGMAEAELNAQQLAPRRVDVLADGTGPVESAAAVIITGGDPFRLLSDLRASGADRILADAHSRGIPIAGQSAGAIVCAPTLEAIRITSPFPAPAELDLRGLGLSETLVLPHQDRPGRAALHRHAAASHGESSRPSVALMALWDDEVLLLDGRSWSIVQSNRRTRIATTDDADAAADLFHEASRRAWAPFLGDDRLARRDRDVAGWSRRIAIGGRRFLVTEDDHGLAGFVSYRQAADEDSGIPTGELDLLYTHPRAHGTGIGRRLLERATWNLLCEGFREAVLWTEAGNERALGIYRRSGWHPDGAVDERDYLGVPIRNLRHRLDLTRYAGGE